MNSLRLRVALLGPAALLVVAAFLPVTTGACKAACTGDETAECATTHTSCVSACGNGTILVGGLPQPDPNYPGCVNTCNDNQCTCLNECGSACN